MMIDRETLKIPQLHVFLGVGGVGKTTLSAAWALHHARRGQRVALITIDPAKRLAQLLGHTTLPAWLSPTPLSDHLWVMMLDQETTARQIAGRFTNPDQLDILLDNPYFGVFSRSLAGVQEMMAIYEVHEALMSERFDLVVLDTPPAQHALDFFEVPHRLSSALDSAALSWLQRRSTGSSSPHSSSDSSMLNWRARVGGLGRRFALRALSSVTSEDFIGDVFEFIELFAQVLNHLKDRGLTLESLLKSDRTSMWIVTRPDPSALESAAHLQSELKDRGYSAQGWFLNRVSPLLYQALISNTQGAPNHPWEPESELCSWYQRGKACFSDRDSDLEAQEFNESQRRDIDQAWQRERNLAQVALKAINKLSPTCSSSAPRSLIPIRSLVSTSPDPLRFLNTLADQFER